MVDGPAVLVGGCFRTPERSHHPGELHAGATGLEGRAALLEEINRILQMPSRGFRIAGSRCHETGREAGQRPQRSRSCLVRDGGELGDRMRRFVRAALCRAKLGEVVERRPPFRDGFQRGAVAGFRGIPVAGAKGEFGAFGRRAQELAGALVSSE